ncbi:MAG: hypothetical protein ABIE68_01785 [bacterium]
MKSPNRDFFNSRQLILSLKRAVQWYFIALFLVIIVGSFSINSPVPEADAAGIDSDNITTTLANYTVDVNARVTVEFTPGTIGAGDDIYIYLGEDQSGSLDHWDIASTGSGDCACAFGAGGSINVSSLTNATLSLPTVMQASVASAGTGNITCTIGNNGGGANDPDNPSVASGYSIAVVTTDDNGAGIVYVGDNNDVTINAAVLPLLTLDLDNAGGNCTITAGVATCAMGVLTTSLVSEGNYDVNAFTNAPNSMTVQIIADAELDDGGNNIDPIVEDTGTVTAGSEEYGIAVTADAGLTENLANGFNDDDTPIPTGVATTVVTSAGPITSDDTTINHRVAISSSTPVGTYEQIVTWTASADF